MSTITSVASPTHDSPRADQPLIPSTWDRTASEILGTAHKFEVDEKFNRGLAEDEIHPVVIESAADTTKQRWTDLLVECGIGEKLAAHGAQRIFIDEQARDAEAVDSVVGPGPAAPAPDATGAAGRLHPPAAFPKRITPEEAVVMFIENLALIARPKGAVVYDDMQFEFGIYMFMTNHPSTLGLTVEELAFKCGRSVPCFNEHCKRWSEAFGIRIPANRVASARRNISAAMVRFHADRPKKAKVAANPRTGKPPGRPKKFGVDRLRDVWAGEAMRRGAVVEKLTRIGMGKRTAERIVTDGLELKIIVRTGGKLEMETQPISVPAPTKILAEGGVIDSPPIQSAIDFQASPRDARVEL